MRFTALEAFAIRNTVAQSFEKKWFTVCPLTNLADARGKYDDVWSMPEYRALGLMHTVDFDRMPSEVIAELKITYLKVLSVILECPIEINTLESEVRALLA